MLKKSTNFIKSNLVSIINIGILTLALGLFVMSIFYQSANSDFLNAATNGIAVVPAATPQCPNGLTPDTVSALCGTVSICKTATSTPGECTYQGMVNGVYNSQKDCGVIKPAPAVGYTWSCYSAKGCVQERADTCLVKSGSSCVSCGCSETSVNCKQAKATSCVNGATSYSCKCDTCGNTVSYACDQPLPEDKSFKGKLVCTDNNDPSNPGATTVKDVTNVTIEVYNSLGQKVGTNVSTPQEIQQGIFTIKATNQLPGEKYSVRIVDTSAAVPAITAKAIDAVGFNVSAPTQTCTPGANSSGESLSYCYTKCIKGTKSEGNSESYETCEIKGTFGIGYNFNVGACNTPVAPKPDIEILKTVNAPVVTKGDSAIFTLKISNNGSVNVAGPIVVKDTLPIGLVLNKIESVGNAWACTSKTNADTSTSIECKYPNALNVGVVLPLIYITATPTEFNKTYINVSDVYSESIPGGPIGETNPNNNHSEATVKTNPEETLVLKCLTNPSVPAGNVIVGDSFAVNLGTAQNSSQPGKLVSDTPAICTATANTINFVAAGLCSYHVEWNKSTTGNVTPNTVSCPGTVVTVVEPAKPDITILKTVDNPVVNKGDQAVFTLKISNSGTVNVNGPIVIDDVLPIGLILNKIESEGNSWACTSSAVQNEVTKVKCKFNGNLPINTVLPLIYITATPTEFNKTYINVVDVYSESIPGGAIGETNPNNNHSEAPVKTNPEPVKVLSCTTNPSVPNGSVLIGEKFTVNLGAAQNSSPTGKLVSDTPSVCTVSDNIVSFNAAGTCKYHVEWNKGEGNISPEAVSCPGSAVTVLTPLDPKIQISKELTASGANFATYTINVINTGNVTLKNITVNDIFESEHFVIESSTLGYTVSEKTENNIKLGTIVFNTINEIKVNSKYTITLKFKIVGEEEDLEMACNRSVGVTADYVKYSDEIGNVSDTYTNPTAKPLCVNIPVIKYDKMYLTVSKKNVTAPTVKVRTQNTASIVEWVIETQAVCGGNCKPITQLKFTDTYENEFLTLVNMDVQKFDSKGTVDKSDDVETSTKVSLISNGVKQLTTIEQSVDANKQAILYINNVLPVVGGSMKTGEYLVFKMSTDAKKVGENVRNTVIVEGPNDKPTANAVVNIESRNAVLAISVESLPDTAGGIISIIDFNKPGNLVAMIIAIISLTFIGGIYSLNYFDKNDYKVSLFSKKI
jgi:uncharacterized repeat protein (TIGR01451 family)